MRLRFPGGTGWASPGARVTGGLSPTMRGETPRWRNPRRTWVENLTTLGPTSPPDARRLRFSGQKRGVRAFPPLSPGIMPVSFLGAPRTLYVPPTIHWRAAPAVSADFHRPWRMVVSVGAPAPLIIRASPTLPLWPEKTSSRPPAAGAALPSRRPAGSPSRPRGPTGCRH